jgi:hypothetical protein
MTRSFGIEVGVVPTEDAKVIETHRLIRKLHKRVCCLVDGDPAGLGYVNQLRNDPTPPSAIIRWNEGAMIEDAIGWILNADEPSVVGKLAEISSPAPASSADVVAYLKAKKMDIIAYEFLAEAISTTSACRGRAADLLSGLACACADDETTQRFVRGVDGVWVFQP